MDEGRVRFLFLKNNELNLLQRIKTQTVPEENFLVSETKLYVLEHLN